jgi:hypothetical protein
MYPAVLANLGTLDTAGPMSDVFEPAACSSTSENYRGEAYLEETLGSASIEFFSPNRLRLRVQTAEPATLVVNQNYDPGWQSPTAPVVAAHGLISMSVPAGDHTVELHYRPFSVVLGAIISGCSALALLMFVALRGLTPNNPFGWCSSRDNPSG